GPSHPFGAISPLCQAVSLLRAQHVPRHLAVLGFLQNEVCARLCVVCSCGRFVVSHPSLRNWTDRCPVRTEPVLSTIRRTATVGVVCRAGGCAPYLALAGVVVALLQWFR